MLTWFSLVADVHYRWLRYGNMRLEPEVLGRGRGFGLEIGQKDGEGVEHVGEVAMKDMRV